MFDGFEDEVGELIQVGYSCTYDDVMEMPDGCGVCARRLSARCRNGRSICMVICRGMLMSRATSRYWATRYVSTPYPNFYDFVWFHAKLTGDCHVVLWRVGSCDGDSSRSGCGSGYGGPFQLFSRSHFFHYPFD